MIEKIQDLLEHLVLTEGSDLHLTPNNRPLIRHNGELQPIAGQEKFSAKEVEELLFSLLTETRKNELEAHRAIDFSFGIEGLARFRANFFSVDDGWAGDAWSGIFRVIPFTIRSFEELGLPPVVSLLCQKPRGLVLVTGPTGSGKSTTLAAMIDKINNERREHILTVEDPIEFVHRSKNCSVNQREVGRNVKTFAEALRSGLRQDPDVVLIGEMRDLETMEMALKAAETGHLTFATLHTNSAAATINRLVGAFPENQQGQIRAQLSLTLEGVLSQSLIPRKDGRGRVMALEVMTGSEAVRNLIRNNEIEGLYSKIQTGYKDYQMQTMEMSLAQLVTEQKIDEDAALNKSSQPNVLKDLIKNGGGALINSARKNLLSHNNL